MRAYEFINEAKTGKMPKGLGQSAPAFVKFRDDGWDRGYALSRVMMAAAMHDGKTPHKVDMDSASFADRYNTAHPLTPEERNMLRGAINTVGGEHHDLVADEKSSELPDINKTSPVAGFAGYPRKRK